MQDMPAFLHFWGMTPSEFRGLKLGEYRAMIQYQQRFMQRQTWDVDQTYETIRTLNGR